MRQGDQLIRRFAHSGDDDRHLIALGAGPRHALGYVGDIPGITYRRAAGFGDTIEIHTTVTKGSDYRLSFQQNVHRPDDDELLVEGIIELVCVNSDNELVPLPPSVTSLV